MTKEPINIFKLMYLALDKVWQKEKNNLFGLYLAEADPFLTGKDSADPAVFLGFTTCFEKYGNYESYGYDFIVKYLSNLDPYYGDLKHRFLTLTKEEYVKDSEAYSQMTDKEIIRKNNWEQSYPRVI